METQNKIGQLPIGKIESRKSFSPVFVPDNVYDSVVREIVPIETEYGHTLVFSFQIAGGEHDGKIVDGLCSVSFKEGSKLKSWAETMLGHELSVGEELDVSSLVGKKARILVGHKERTDRDGNGFKQSGVEKVLG